MDQSNEGLLGCEMEFECPRTWESMKPTADPRVRHCAACGKDVVLCESQQQLKLVAAARGCVAFYRQGDEPARGASVSRMTLGLPRGIVGPDGWWREGEK
jgi:hypothetical protein